MTDRRVKRKAPSVAGATDKAKTGISRKRRPWLESYAKVSQVLGALANLGAAVDPEDLRRAYAALGRRRVAKENNPEWLRAQLEKVSGRKVELVRPAPPASHYVEAADEAYPAPVYADTETVS